MKFKLSDSCFLLFLLTFHMVQGESAESKESFLSRIAPYSELMMVGSLCMLPVCILLGAYAHAQQKMLEQQKTETDKEADTLK